MTLGVFALLKKQGRGLALAGIILGALAVLASLGTTVALFSGVTASRSDAPQPAAIVSSEATEKPTPTATTEPSATPTVEPTVAPAPTPTQPPAPVETLSQSNAKRQAINYLDYSAFSRSGLIGQLQYEGYSLEDATYGVDSLGVDWATQAAIKAQEYLDYSAFSHSGLVDQLVYEGFTAEEAEFGVTFIGL